MTDLIFSKAFIVIGVIFLVLTIYGLGRSLVSNYGVDSEINQLEKKIADLEQQNRDMTQFIDYLQTDDFVAREARLKLGLKKAGENLVIVKDDEMEKIKASESQTAEAQNQKANDKKSNIAKWFDYLFH